MPGPQRRTAARTAVVWDALRAALPDAPGHVVDIGGGTGGFAVRIAELGHRVTVVDPNPDALAILARRAQESGVAGRVTARQGELASLGDHVAARSADVVVCHGVLEIVAAPAEALTGITAVLRAGGRLSLLVNQWHAAVVARAMAGHFQQARTLLDDPSGGGPPRRFTADQVVALAVGAGLRVTATHAVRVFVDLVPSGLVDAEPGAADALVELERAVAARPDYLSLATQIHLLAVKA